MDEKRIVRIEEALEDFRKRLSRGEAPRASEYRDRVQADYEEFLRCLAQDSWMSEAFGADDRGTDLPAIPGYAELERVGRGSFGTVYRARHVESGEIRALKVLGTEWLHDEDAVARFRREIEVGRTFAHPHLAPLLDAGTWQGQPYLASAFYAGGSLDAHSGMGEADVLETVRRFADLADALAALHGNEPRVLHRDIKPSNILIAGDGGYVLGDFGLAQLTGDASITTTGHTLGTLRFASPEQAQGDRSRIDARSDIYSLGASLYEVLSGKPLFPQTAQGELFAAIVAGPIESLHEAAPHVPRPVSDLVMACVQRRQEDRPPDAVRLAAELRKLAAGGDGNYRPPSRPRMLARWLRAHPRRVCVGVAVVLLAAVWSFLLRRAHLDVASIPSSAEIVVDGVATGTSPLFDIALSRGAHRIEARLPGFRSYEAALDLKAGERVRLTPELVAVDAEAAFASLSRLLRLDPRREIPPGDRAVPALPKLAHLLHPRGDVRGRDLDSFRAEAGRVLDGTLFIEDGTSTVWSSPVREETRWIARPIAAETASLLRTGREYRWGYALPDGSRIEAPFRLVDDVPDPRVEQADDLPSNDVLPAADVMHLVILQEHGLHAAALRRAEELIKRWPAPIVLELAWTSIVALDLTECDFAQKILVAYVPYRK